MVFSVKVMPPGVSVPITVPGTPVAADHGHVQPDFHFAVEASDDDTFADLRNRALQYIKDDQAKYLQKHSAENFDELKLERGTTLRPKQKVSSIFPGHASAEEIVLLLYHRNDQPLQARKRKAPEQPLPTPDTLKRSKGKERATEPAAAPSSSNVIQRMMSSQRSQTPAARRVAQFAVGDAKQAPHWSLEEDRALLPHILNGKSIKDALELAGLSETRSKSAGRNRRKFYNDKKVTLNNLQQIRIQSSRGRVFATAEHARNNTQLPQRSVIEPASKPKEKKSTSTKQSKSLGSKSMPPPSRPSNLKSAPSIGAQARSPQSTDDALLDLLGASSDDESDVVYTSTAPRASDEPPQHLTLAPSGQNGVAGAEANAERVAETQSDDEADKAVHEKDDEDGNDVILFEDMSGSVDEEVPRDDLDLGSDQLVESDRDFDGGEHDDLPRRFMHVSETAYQRVVEAGIASRQAIENHDGSHQDDIAESVHSDTEGAGLPDLPLTTIEPKVPADPQPRQITRPPRHHASDRTDEALKARARKKCLHFDRDGSWYVDYLVYQRDLQYAREEGDVDGARTLTSDFDHRDLQYRLKFSKRGPDLFDGHGDFGHTPLIMRQGDDVPQMIYSQNELKQQKEAYERRGEQLKQMRSALDCLDEVRAQDVRLRAVNCDPDPFERTSTGEETESENEAYYTVPSSTRKPREEAPGEQVQASLRQAKLLKAKLSKLERKALNCAAKRAAKVRNACA